jgi:hypothetical protein
MTDENTLSRRGFLGILAAIGLAPTIVPKPAEAEPDHTFAEDVTPKPENMGGTQLYFEEDGNWRRVGQVTEVEGPSGLTPIREILGVNTGIVFTVLMLPLFNNVGVFELLVTNESAKFQLAFDDGLGTAWEFEAFVSAFDMDEPIDGYVSVQLTLDVFGEPSFVDNQPGTIEI